jgi:ankyrin repeat protein
MGYAKAITILKAAGADVNRLDKLGRPAMNVAAQNGHAEAIAALKAAGADVNKAISRLYARFCSR